MSIDADFERAGEGWRRNAVFRVWQAKSKSGSMFTKEDLASYVTARAAEAAAHPKRVATDRRSWAERWYAGQHNSR